MFQFSGEFVRAHDVLSTSDLRFPQDIEDYPPGATKAIIDGRKTAHTRHTEQLSSRKSIEAVYAYEVADRHVALLGRMPWLTRLGLRNLKATDLSPLAELRSLEVLYIEDAAKLESLDVLRTLPNLRAFSIMDAKRLKELSAFEDASQLELVALHAGMWNPMKVETLKPVAALKKVRDLRLVLQVVDQSLEPLHRLTSLENLKLTIQFPLEQFARLAAFLPASCLDLLTTPYGELQGLCKVDATHTSILPAKGVKRFCRDCDPQRFLAYMGQFHRLREEAVNRGAWI
jgi:hypothetical protein